MATQQQSDPEPVAKLVSYASAGALSKAARSELGLASKEQASGLAIVLSGITRADIGVLEWIVSMLPLSRERRRKLGEARIAKLVEMYLEREELAGVDLEIERDNALLRAAYLKNTPCYSAQDIRSFHEGAPPKNPSDPAARWKREKRIFAVPHRGGDLFPAFQFEDGKPHTGLKAILRALPKYMSPWQIAFWFASGNGWLDGAAPQEHLKAPDEVAAAALRLHDTAVG